MIPLLWISVIFIVVLFTYCVLEGFAKTRWNYYHREMLDRVLKESNGDVIKYKALNEAWHEHNLPPRGIWYRHKIPYSNITKLVQRRNPSTFWAIFK